MSATDVHAGAPATAELDKAHPSIIYGGKNYENAENRVLFKENLTNSTIEVPHSAPDQNSAPSTSVEDWATQQQEVLAHAISMGASNCPAC